MPSHRRAGPEPDIPPRETTRWVARQKARVVHAIRRGQLTVEEACGRYHLSAEELAAWQRALDDLGLRGLRAGRARGPARGG